MNEDVFFVVFLKACMYVTDGSPCSMQGSAWSFIGPITYSMNVTCDVFSPGSSTDSTLPTGHGHFATSEADRRTK